MVAEAFDSAVNALSGGTKIKNFPSWFYKTVRRVAAKRIRQAEDLFERGGDIASALHPGDATLAELEERERRDARMKERAIAHAAARPRACHPCCSPVFTATNVDQDAASAIASAFAASFF